MSAGRALRIASASIPARILTAGAGDVRSAPGTGELHAGLDNVFQARVGLAERLASQLQAPPGLFMRARRRGCGLSPGRSPGNWAPNLSASA
jgi:hypothetical protein